MSVETMNLPMESSSVENVLEGTWELLGEIFGTEIGRYSVAEYALAGGAILGLLWLARAGFKKAINS